MPSGILPAPQMSGDVGVSSMDTSPRAANIAMTATPRQRRRRIHADIVAGLIMAGLFVGLLVARLIIAGLLVAGLFVGLLVARLIVAGLLVAGLFVGLLVARLLVGLLVAGLLVEQVVQRNPAS